MQAAAPVEQRGRINSFLQALAPEHSIQWLPAEERRRRASNVSANCSTRRRHIYVLADTCALATENDISPDAGVLFRRGALDSLPVVRRASWELIWRPPNVLTLMCVRCRSGRTSRCAVQTPQNESWRRTRTRSIAYARMPSRARCPSRHLACSALPAAHSETPFLQDTGSGPLSSSARWHSTVGIKCWVILFCCGRRCSFLWDWSKRTGTI